MLVQVAISMLAYAIQLGVVHVVPAPRRRAIWVALRLVAALALATLWMLGTWVLRAPASLAHGIAAAGAWLRASPGALIAAPLAGLARGSLATTGLGLFALGGLALAAAALARAIARRAGMRGWEEAGAIWAEVGAAPAPRARPVTAASKDLLLVARDRPQLLALIAMPIIFVGVQIFGAAGWSWSTGSLTRVSCVAYSLALYMATIGPLTHMQAERRAFWILRTVPVPLGRLLAAKARAWAIIVGGTAAVTFGVLSLAVPELSMTARLGTGLLVTVSAAGMCFLAVAMASGGADLSDDQSTAVGPGTIYAFLLVGGLFNLVLIGTPATRVAGLALYLFASWAYWRSGVARAAICMDAEAVRTRRFRVADGATLLIVYAVGEHAAGAIPAEAGTAPVAAGLVRVGLLLVLAVVAAGYLARRPPLARRVGIVRALVLGASSGALVGHAARLAFAAAEPVPQLDLVAMALALAGLAGEELILRGVVQHALEQELAVAARPWWGRLLGAVAATGLGTAAAVMAGGGGGLDATAGLTAGALGLVLATQATAALAFLLTGRVAAAWAARVAALLLCAFL
jgi:hypothetical protein